MTPQAGCSYYGHSQRHAVRKAGSTVYCYDANGNMVSRGGQAVSYTSYNLPALINGAGASSQFWYTPERRRWQQVAQSSAGTETTIYVGGQLEKVTRPSGTEYRHYVAAGSVRVVVTRSASGQAIRYLPADHLGSVSAIIDQQGAVLAKLSFAAFGARRGSNWTGAPTSGETSQIEAATRSGYTGHDHLDNLALIHMHGRVYDPRIGRFLSRDPLVADPGRGQDYNGYAYVRNGPLRYTDPTGWGPRSIADLPLMMRIEVATIHVRSTTSVVDGVVTGRNQYEQVAREVPRLGYQSYTVDNWNAFGTAGTFNYGNGEGGGGRSGNAGSSREAPGDEEVMPCGPETTSQGSVLDWIPDAPFGLPPFPDWAVNFSAGLGDVLLLGFGDEIRARLYIGSVDMTSTVYGAGEVTGGVALLATGVAGGVRAAGARGAGMEFSHTIPARMGGPRSIWNGNYVTPRTHALSDPYRYNFMSREWKRANPMPGRASQLWTRTPNTIKGTAAGASAAALGLVGAGC